MYIHVLPFVYGYRSCVENISISTYDIHQCLEQGVDGLSAYQ